MTQRYEFIPGDLIVDERGRYGMLKERLERIECPESFSVGTWSHTSSMPASMIITKVPEFSALIDGKLVISTKFSNYKICKT